MIKRKGRLSFQGRNGFEILLERLCAVEARWLALVEHADLAEEQKWVIFNLLMRGDARVEEMPGLGLKGFARVVAICFVMVGASINEHKGARG